MNSPRARLLPLLLLCVLLMGGAGARAATLTVSSLADDGSAGTLRTQVGTASPGDTIDFSVTGTISLTSGTLSITKNLTIIGPTTAPGITVSGGSNGAKRNLNISAQVTISDLTISDGQINPNSYPVYPDTAGGGIFNTGPLTLTNCVISNNSGQFGGGIFNSGTLTVTGGNIANNISYDNDSCGGILNDGGTVTITNGTL